MKKIIILSLAFMFILTGCNKSKTAKKILGIEEAKTTAENFINDNLMSGGVKAEVTNISDDPNDEDFYKMTVDVGSGKGIESYLSKDGKRFFPQMMKIGENGKIVGKDDPSTNSEQTKKPANTNIPKQEKPSVELFVMSHCPYGTQIEKGILPVIETLGDSIDFDLKFCTYSMHGKKELDEQLQQHCVKKQGKDKLLSYLGCFLEDGEGEKCLGKVGVDMGALKTCVANTDKEFKITEKFNDKSTWSGGRFPLFEVYSDSNKAYGITGSPGLVVNGTKVSSARDSASLLATICSGFENEPDACSAKLSSASPSTGFGYEEGSAGSAGSCN